MDILAHLFCMREFLNKKNLFNLLLLGIMVLAVPLTVKLVKQQQILFSRANAARVEFLTPDFGGTNCVINRGGNKVAVCSDVKVRITAPTEPDIHFQSPTPQPATRPPRPPGPNCGSLFDKIQASFNRECGSPIYDKVADLNKDRRVNGLDSTMLVPHFTDENWCAQKLADTTDPCAQSSPTPTPTPAPPPGCHYEDVVCVRAPCPQQLICSSPSPSLQPDLIVDSFNTVGTSLSPGTSPYFDVSIKNIGQATAAVTGGFSVRIDIINPNNTNIGHCIGISNNIEPNNFGTFNVRGCPAFDLAGRYTVTAQVDPDNKISESDETNNTKTITLNVAAFSSPSPSPDAVIAGAVPFRVSFDPNFATIAGQGTVNLDTGEVIIDITLPPGTGPKPVYLQFFENGAWVPNPPIVTTIEKLL